MVPTAMRANPMSSRSRSKLPTQLPRERRGQKLLEVLRQEARLELRDAEVVWVAKLDSQPVSSFRFLDQATDALKSEQPEWAVVAAQTHLEIHVRVLAEQTAEAAPSALLDAIMGLQEKRQWAPHNPHLQPILEALYGVKMTECEAWSAYRAHVSRRNAIVHEEMDHNTRPPTCRHRLAPRDTGPAIHRNRQNPLRQLEKPR